MNVACELVYGRGTVFKHRNPSNRKRLIPRGGWRNGTQDLLDLLDQQPRSICRGAKSSYRVGTLKQTEPDLEDL